MVNRTCVRKLKWIAVFLFYMVLVITLDVAVHGKSGFTGGKESGVFCVALIELNDAFTVIELTDLIINFFYIIAFVGKESTFRNG